MEVKIKLIENGKIPIYKRDGDACLDCFARISGGSIAIPPYEKSKARVLVNLGFALELPAGWEAQIRPRSGNSKDGIDITLGTGDPTYRGEYMACIVNNRPEPFVVNDGDRICQLAIREAPHIEFKVVDELSETIRGSNGFGSSGR